MAKAPIPPAPRPMNKIIPAPPGKPLPMGNVRRQTLPPLPRMPARKAPRPRPTALAGVPEGKGPPLFIKIDKYRDVVSQLSHLKSYSLSLRDALDALADIEKELQKGISITHRALDKFNTTIATIDAKITRMPPKDSDVPPKPMGEMDDYVKELHDQMEKIKSDLKSINF